MWRRLKHWQRVALIAVAAAVVIAAAVAAGPVPYLPIVHGSRADEIERLVAWLDVEPGKQIADVGAGDGRYAMALARRVGASGRVYATEIDRDHLAGMRRAATAAGLSNVTVIEGAVTRTNLPDACCDAILTRLVYHHLSDAPSINADLVAKLRPGGRLLIIDFEPGGLLAWIGLPQQHGHGTAKDTVIEQVSAAGLQPVRGPEWWRGRVYAVLFVQK
jgi:ubiquinone/menaquinone biosynthesis C-methylase UbiE